MREHQKDYEAYMKKVTDAFISMQSETTTQEHLKNVMSQMLIVEWNGGLDWKAIKTEEMFRDGNLMEENRQYNSEIAKKYLKENAISYDEFVKNYTEQDTQCPKCNSTFVGDIGYEFWQCYDCDETWKPKK